MRDSFVAGFDNGEFHSRSISRSFLFLLIKARNEALFLFLSLVDRRRNLFDIVLKSIKFSSSRRTIGDREPFFGAGFTPSFSSFLLLFDTSRAINDSGLRAITVTTL